MLGWGKLLASLWLALFASLRLVVLTAIGWQTGPAKGWRAASPKLTHLLGSILAYLGAWPTIQAPWLAKIEYCAEENQRRTPTNS